jgi:hypothetical protein
MEDFLKSNGFKLIDAANSEFFGDYYETFSNDAYELRFISDRSFKSIGVKSIEENDNWYDLALIKALLYNEKELSHVATFDVYNKFLEDELSKISNLFSLENYPDTKRKLDELGNERARQMFPNLKQF